MVSPPLSKLSKTFPSLEEFCSVLMGWGRSHCLFQENWRIMRSNQAFRDVSLPSHSYHPELAFSSKLFSFFHPRQKLRMRQSAMLKRGKPASNLGSCLNTKQTNFCPPPRWTNNQGMSNISTKKKIKVERFQFVFFRGLYFDCYARNQLIWITGC